MNYFKIYNSLVDKARSRGLDRKSVDYYTEIHHIVPRSMGGSNDSDNLVMFNAREHILAHVLLWKAYPNNYKLAHAANMMCKTREYGKRVPSKVLAKLSEESAKFASMKKEGAGYGETRHINLSGKRFGRLQVMDTYTWHTFPNGQRKAKWKCICDCGEVVHTLVTQLQSGSTKSCGCLHKEATSLANRKWSFSRKLYETYHNMISRCYDPRHKSHQNFKKYGIEVCERWLGEDGINNFYEDMGEKPEGLYLVRVDPLRNFEKENCKWVTKVEASKSIYKFPRSKKSKTGRVGVKFDKRRNHYIARIVLNGKEKNKAFLSLEEAVEFRDFIEELMKD